MTPYKTIHRMSTEGEIKRPPPDTGGGLSPRRVQLVAGEGFEPSTFGLCLPLQLSLPGYASLWSGLSLHPRTGSAAVRVPAVKSLHLLSRPYCRESLARGYPANGFPEFDRLSRVSFPTRSPLQDQVPGVTV